ncbi:adenosylcobinamide-GDP ribazoletransferase, partial [Rhodococcus chondri]
ERAREVMHSGGAGPFGVVALIVVLGVQALALGELAEARAWIAIVTAVAVGRVAVVLACRHGVPPAAGSSFGTLVAGSVRPVVLVGWAVAATAASALVSPALPWLGPAAVLAALALSVLFVRHCVARFGGLNGDVLGAALEGSVALVAVVAACAL